LLVNSELLLKRDGVLFEGFIQNAFSLVRRLWIATVFYIL
jgi:hypothetical protein